MKVASIVGARPQFIKAAPVSKALRAAGASEFLIHTGQHYDRRMSQLFFEELGIAAPDVNLGVGSGTHAWQTAQMLVQSERVLLEQKPDWVLVYGDTNSTLAGALAACKLQIPLAHVEAGLRSFNSQMPEEHNRILTDHCSDFLFCPTGTAVKNLSAEGITSGVHLSGDTMYDATLQFAELSRRRSTILDDLKLKRRSYLLATVHRPYNTDSPESLGAILSAFRELGEPVVFPVHPRTRSKIADLEGARAGDGNLRTIEPVGYLDMLALEQNARMILTDSGGMQKEAYFFRVPCVTLRPETEWTETVEAGWNVLVGADTEQIIEATQRRAWPADNQPELFGDGHAAERIAKVLAAATGNPKL